MSAWPGQIKIIERASVRRDKGLVSHPVHVLKFRGLGREHGTERIAVFLGRVLPIGPDRVPTIAQALDISVAVLRDNGLDTFGMLYR
jgi:hypothetical protein